MFDGFLMAINKNMKRKPPGKKETSLDREEERHKPRQLFFFHNLFGCAEAVS